MFSLDGTVKHMGASLKYLTHKEKSLSEYARRIRLAKQFINTNLHTSLTLDMVAKESYFSPYHFHRIFHSQTGETLNTYITRKRMEASLSILLGSPHMSITEIAIKGGFSSSANFSKAFSQYFGVSPSVVRRPDKFEDQQGITGKNGKLYRKYGKAFDPRLLYSQRVTQKIVFDPDKLKEQLMDIRVETMEEKSVASMRSPRGYEIESVYETWECLLGWAKAQGVVPAKNESFAICHDNPTITPEEKCGYEATVVIPKNCDVSGDVNRATIPGGTYAVSYFKDSAENISPFVTEVCAQWLPQSGFEPDNFPLMFNYLNNAKEDGFVEMDIYIKIKPLRSR